MNIGPVELFYPLVCEDIRREDNGKEIVIGIFTGEIIVSRLPGNLILSLYIPFKSSTQGEFPIEFKILGPHDVVYASGHGSFLVSDAKLSGAFHINKVPCQVQSAGIIKFLMRQAGVGEYLLIKDIPVRAEDVTTQPLP